MKIAKVIAREIFDSRCIPTVECQIILENGRAVYHSVPSGVSTSRYEAVELRDGQSNFSGLGVLKAVEYIETLIGPELIGKEPDLVTTDFFMLELDGTENMKKLGANTTLAVSGAISKAQAVVNELELFEFFAHICDFESVTISFPMFNAIEGGMHVSHSNLLFQEFLVIPVGQRSYRACLESAVTFFHALQAILFKKGPVIFGPEGGFAPVLESETQALDYLMMAREAAKQNSETDFVFSLDVAASSFYNSQNQLYKYKEGQVTADEMLQVYSALAQAYPLYSIEDGLAQDDETGWKELIRQCSGSVRIIGDDIYASHADRIMHALQEGFIDMAIIKPSQVGTLTQTLQAVKLCKENNVPVVISHRCGETEDTLIADLAVGVSAQHIKAGGCFHAERMAKYLRLVRIEDSLMLSLMN